MKKFFSKARKKDKCGKKCPRYGEASVSPAVVIPEKQTASTKCAEGEETPTLVHKQTPKDDLMPIVATNLSTSVPVGRPEADIPVLPFTTEHTIDQREADDRLFSTRGPAAQMLHHVNMMHPKTPLTWEGDCVTIPESMWEAVSFAALVVQGPSVFGSSDAGTEPGDATFMENIDAATKRLALLNGRRGSGDFFLQRILVAATEETNSLFACTEHFLLDTCKGEDDSSHYTSRCFFSLPVWRQRDAFSLLLSSLASELASGGEDRKDENRVYGDDDSNDFCAPTTDREFCRYYREVLLWALPPNQSIEILETLGREERISALEVELSGAEGMSGPLPTYSGEQVNVPPLGYLCTVVLSRMVHSGNITSSELSKELPVDLFKTVMACSATTMAFREDESLQRLSRTQVYLRLIIRLTLELAQMKAFLFGATIDSVPHGYRELRWITKSGEAASLKELFADLLLSQMVNNFCSAGCGAYLNYSYYNVMLNGLLGLTESKEESKTDQRDFAKSAKRILSWEAATYIFDQGDYSEDFLNRQSTVFYYAAVTLAFCVRRFKMNVLRSLAKKGYQPALMVDMEDEILRHYENLGKLGAAQYQGCEGRTRWGTDHGHAALNNFARWFLKASDVAKFFLGPSGTQIASWESMKRHISSLS